MFKSILLEKSASLKRGSRRRQRWGRRIGREEDMKISVKLAV